MDWFLNLRVIEVLRVAVVLFAAYWVLVLVLYIGHRLFGKGERQGRRR